MSAEVTINGGPGYGRHTFSAARSAVAPLLRKRALCDEDHWCLEFEGTREELIAAGLAAAELFVFGKSGTRSGYDSLGNRFTLIARRDGSIRARAADALG